METVYAFMDGYEAVNPAEGPTLLHYRDTCLHDIQQRNEIAWNDVVAERILLPASFIRLI